jgi:tetratricopeptide (TPR) repeat protein
MHTIFRIDNIQLAADRLWNIRLTLTDEAANPQLKPLTQTLREETSKGTGWAQLASVLLKTGGLLEAEKIYQKLLQKAKSDNDETAVTHLHHQLAYIYSHMGEYSKALEFHQKALDTCLLVYSSAHLHVAMCYDRLGGAYHNLNQLEVAPSCTRSLSVF